MTVAIEDICVALGRTASDSVEISQWNMWIDDAHMLIRARLGDLTLLDQQVLDYVVREAVVAQIKRPDDATNVAVTLDDGSVSRTYKTSAGRVTIRDEWWGLLSPNGPSRQAFSIVPSASSSRHLPWCDVAFGSSCSCGVVLAGDPLFEAG